MNISTIGAIIGCISGILIILLGIKNILFIFLTTIMGMILVPFMINFLSTDNTKYIISRIQRFFKSFK